MGAMNHLSQCGVKLKFHGSSFLVASSRGCCACQRGCYENVVCVDEDATTKLHPWNLGFLTVVTLTVAKFIVINRLFLEYVFTAFVLL